MGLVQHAVCGKIPHLGVAIGNLDRSVGASTSQGRTTYILLHAQKGFPRLVLSVAHVAELGEVLIGGLFGVFAPETGAGPLFAATLKLEVIVWGTPG